MPDAVATAACLAAGGNRHPSAAAWNASSATNHDFVAYGADCNVALWDAAGRGGSPSGRVFALLSGHAATVTAVAFCSTEPKPILVTGSADGDVRIWNSSKGSITQSKSVQQPNLHSKSINAITAIPGSDLFITASADTTLAVWHIAAVDASDEVPDVSLVQQLKLSPSFIPLTVAIARLQDSDSLVLAVAGTRTFVQIYTSSASSISFCLAATLTGHEGWIRSLSFTSETESFDSDLLLASASQDKYIRLWRVKKTSSETNEAHVDSLLAGTKDMTLSNKAYNFKVDTDKAYSITFEALLLGHEDWIYTAQWSKKDNVNRLLSASADNSLAIWELDGTSGVWVCTVRLGEISAQKGATTATGSTGGFWIGLWSPDGASVLSLGRTGSWRMWQHAAVADQWEQQVAVTGHTKAVQGLAWASNGSYLLTTSADQTTRVFAEWRRSAPSVKNQWYEFSRAQIHGYDLNCLASISPTQFVSGADEKLLRVFDQPRAVAEMLHSLGGSALPSDRPDVASIPVLGLSNKALESTAENGETEDDAEQARPNLQQVSTKPPTEDILARHLLWPEIEKLYGHGYEISCVASTHSGDLIATACRASSLDHAVIRLFDTSTWREVKPALMAHSLTVTSLAFSLDDMFLLGVSRDRSLTVFERDQSISEPVFRLREKPDKAHTRMVLDCAWLPSGSGSAFATAGRDKTVHIWRLSASGPAERVASIVAAGPVTAVAVQQDDRQDHRIWLAYGLEDGSISVVAIDSRSLQLLGESLAVPQHLHPSKAVMALEWRSRSDDQALNKSAEAQLAIASEDSSVRVLTMNLAGDVEIGK